MALATKELAQGRTPVSALQGSSTVNQIITTNGTFGQWTSLGTLIAAGPGIGISGTTSVTITNNGVTSLAGTSNQINVSASTGGVTLSLPSTVNITSLNLSGLTASELTGTDASKNLTSVAIGSGLSLSGNTLSATGSGGTVTSISGGTGITVSPSPITSTGSVAVNQGFSPTWTAQHKWTYTPVLGTSGGWALAETADPFAQGNTSLIELGSGGFNGGAGAFTGSSLGTYIGINQPLAGTSWFFDFEVDGVQMSDMDSTGNLYLRHPLSPTNGGLGFSSIGAAYSVIGVNNAANAYIFQTLTPGNSITITPSNGAITFDTIQDIRTSASPQWVGANFSGLTASELVGTDASKNLTSIAVGSGLSLSGGVLSSTGSGGTVTSVGLADSTGTFNITNTPVTGAGTLTLSSFKAQSANTALRGPTSGLAAAPTWRADVIADLPAFYSGIGSPVQGAVGYVNSGGNLAFLGAGTANQVLATGGAAANPAWVNEASLLTAGTGIGLSGTTNVTISLSTPVSVANGGTASTSLGTSLTNSGSVLNTIQGIRTADSPQFTGLNVSGLTASQIVGTDGSKNLSSVAIGSGLSLSGGTLTNTSAPGGSNTDIQYLSGGALAGSADMVRSALGQETLSQTSLGTTAADALIGQNTTASTSLAPVQYSPALSLIGHVWNTTATAADNTSRWRIDNRPVSGTSPYGVLHFRSSTDTGSASYADALTLDSQSQLTLPNLGTGSTAILESLPASFAGNMFQANDSSGNLVAQVRSSTTTVQTLTGQTNASNAYSGTYVAGANIAGGTYPSQFGALGQLNMGWQNGTSFTSLGYVQLLATQNHSAGVGGSRMVIGATPTGTATPQAMVFVYGGPSANNPGDVILNASGHAVATNATNGFTWPASMAGPPSGTPALSPTGAAPMVLDTQDQVPFNYMNSVWSDFSNKKVTNLITANYPYTCLSTDGILTCSNVTALRDIMLPPANSSIGHELFFILIGSATNHIDISPNTGDTINNAGSPGDVTVGSGQTLVYYVKITSVGNNAWYVTGGK